jgi:hypothetical protein
LSRAALTYVPGVVRRHRRQIGSCWRRCNPGQQALLVLAHLRKGQMFAVLAAGFGVGTATAWRYVRATVALLAARAPRLRGALRAARKYAYVVLDGTLIPVDRVAADRPFYSGKHRRHGMNLQVISGPAGEILWVYGPLPGAVHDLTAARIWGIIRHLAAARCARPIAAAASRPRRKTPTALMHGSALPASGPTPSSRPGTSCARSAAALEGRAARQGHPRPSNPRDHRMNKRSLTPSADSHGRSPVSESAWLCRLSERARTNAS